MPLIRCSHCKREFIRDIRHINENKKLKQKPYCSLVCSGKSRIKRLQIICENPACKKSFARIQAAVSIHNFCSHSCAAILSNSKRQKMQKICANISCTNIFTGNKKYCSINCVPKNKSRYTKEIILAEICTFTEKHGRIPTKRDLEGVCKMARRHFKTWNKAIKAAGLKPNPVMFTRKHKANDGHICDSLAEKIIDDWLYTKNIDHKRSIPYPGNIHLHVDFVVGNYWIEFFGLHGQHKRYDELRKEKLELAIKYNLKLIEIYPKDLFPDNKLEQILNF